MKLQDLTGQRFGRLTVIDRSENSKCNQVMWNCLCDCGNIKPVRAGALKSGNTTSCGCAHSEEVRERMTRHGMKHTRLYRIWQGMLRRCDNPKRKDFKDYGGRGITVCEEWKKCFTAFRDCSLSNGYRDDEMRKLSFSGIECITVLDRKVIAVDLEGKRYRIQDRLRYLEEILPSYFIRINKSALANEHQIARFDAVFSGGVDAVFRCGYREYVSRRCFAQIRRRYEGV